MSNRIIRNARQIVEARQLWQRVLDGNLRARAEVMETMTTSDFPLLLGVAYGRELLQEYAAIAPVWQRFARRTTVSDFKPKRLVELLGGRAGLEKVKEAAEYPARALTEGTHEFQVEKYGARIPLTWEMLMNDELDAFRDLPVRLAQAARETEDIAATKALLNPAGDNVNTAFFKTVNGNAPATASLTRESLEAAITAITTRKDSEGRPVMLNGGVLMVPPNLEIAARSILSSSEIRRTEGTTTTTEANPLAGRLELVVNPWLTVLNKSAKANSTWFVLPNPNSGRPGVVQGFLRGNESPDLRTKADAGNRVGGGSIAPEEGSFDDDTIQYRVRHVLGAAAVVSTETYVSTGA